ncbi:MAG: glycosyltransferase family 2 protein [Rickettsiales bacterium]
MIAPSNDSNICVVIAAYNAAEYIARAVKSALAQHEVNEVIVADDASRDETVAVARACDDGSGRLKVLVAEKNGGPSVARNRAIAVSSSAWISILDADDFFVDGRMKHLLAHAAEADLLADNMYQVEAADITTRTKRLLPDFAEPLHINFTDFVLANVTQRGTNRMELGFLKPIIRRQFLSDHGITYQEQMRLGEDFELYARALGLGARMLVIPNAGYVSVIRNNSLSAQHSTADLFALRDSSAALATSLPLTAAEQKVLRKHFLSLDCRAQWRRLIDAVKARDLRAAVQCFLRPLPVPLYLAGQLLNQVYERGMKATLKRAA